MRKFEFDRRVFLKGIGLTLLGGCSLPAGGQGKRKPNIVYILADDLGYGILAVMGRRNLRRLRLTVWL